MADKIVYVQPVGDDRDTHYHTLAAAVAGEATDLVSTLDGMLYIIIRGDWSGGPDTTRADIDGYITDATHYIKISTDTANHARTTWDTSKYILQITDENAFNFREDYSWIDGLQIQVIDLTTARNVFINNTRTSGEIKISNCSVRSDGGAVQIRPFGCANGTFTDVIMWNCIFYDWGTHANSYLYLDSGFGTINHYYYNCTFIWGGNAESGIRLDSVGSVLTIKNCYSGDSGDADYNQSAGTITKTTCASADLTGNTTGIAVNTTNFTDVTIDGGENWALPLGSGLIGVGTDTVYADAATDINGETRTSTWDIGADEYVAAAGGVAVYSRYYAKLNS